MLISSRRDVAPSFLNYTLTNATEPAQKKTKVEDHGDDSKSGSDLSIATKLGSSSYSSLTLLRQDAIRVSEEMVNNIRSKHKDDPLLVGRLSVSDLKEIHRIKAMEAFIKDVVEQETHYMSLRAQERDAHSSDSRDSVPPSAPGGTVLTLFGNAPTPRQLFTSAQIPLADRKGISSASELPVEEISLPPGISATKVVSISVDDTKKRTFEDAFTPPLSLPTLPFPKNTKRASVRDGTLSWEFKDPIQRNKKGGYTVQSLTVGDWLCYGGAEAISEPKSPREKRKQRDRALSTGEKTRTQQSKAAQDEALVREEEALFLKAYSSFAPARDNSAALVAERTKNMVWWQQVGEGRFNEAFAIDPALSEPQQAHAEVEQVNGEEVEPSEKTEVFAKIVDDLVSLEQDMEYPTVVRSKTEIDAVMEEISDLIETIASYQRIRGLANPASTTASRNPISPAPSAAGAPETPSEAEVETYHKLRRELAYLLLRLPPYAIAKIDGDQLAELGVSRKILFESRDVKGTMEEDQVSRLAKLAAINAASAVNSRPTSSAGQHYNTTAQRTPAIGQAANTRYGQQYSRTPAPAGSQYQRSGSAQYGTPNTLQPRNTYQLPGARNGVQAPTPAGYNANTSYMYRGGNASPAYSGYKNYQQPQTPQTQPRAGYGARPPQQYPPRATNMAAVNAAGYQASSLSAQPKYSSSSQSGSPSKPANNYAAPVSAGSVQSQNPAAQASAGQSTPSERAPQPATPVNGYQAPAPNATRPQSATPQPSGAQVASAPAASMGNGAQANGSS